ncbi:omega-hydroxypalmitate O-feruloyl transferase-like isoform X1 [Glycine soja]|uniref:Omega-hydroxypalmitate O-feruloyl transferase n=1 Tax=Glycine soja TaxID=3848 RepID=A0A445LKQ3_GLYSO|nr:omega-hydroxypalmitate O-feruloyl transferase-like isoform X1 [Glycine soja]RZC23754.1 Omega-hydroxypalmitate O-feruloyl transferase [Glycine soja]
MRSSNNNHDAPPPPPLLQDLKVIIHNASMIFPSKEIERKSLFLSNIDKVLSFDVETVHFFGAHKDFPPRVVNERLKNALEDALVVYDFLGGRLKLNFDTKRLEMDCNSEGAGFVVASSEYNLDQIGDLDYPNPAFAQLVQKNKDFLKHGDVPLCVAQVTSFKCGGFAIGISTSHTTFDGLSFKTFLDNIASIASKKPLVVMPCHDRHLLAARSPPCVTFPHPEMLKLSDLPTCPDSNIFEASTEQLDFKVFKLTSNDITKLKEEAKNSSTSGGTSTTCVTGFNVITAHIWRCKALSCEDDNPNRSSTILYAVDIRSRLNPPLPKSYAGNAVLTAYATTKCKELEELPFMKLVEMVREGATRMTNEYARSIIDWGETNKGCPNGEVLVSSWWRLGFEEVEYPWGKPKYCCPVVYHRKDIILLFPPIDGGGGVSIIVALPPKEMEKFYGLFNKFLTLD